MNNSIVIDIEKCLGCGRCIAICPVSRFILQDDKAVVSGTKCIACGHCEATCPNKAITVSLLEETAADYATFQIADDWVPYGKYDISALVSLIRSRRSCRHFLDTPVDPRILQDLTQVGVSAPSGTNCQPWMFTVLPNRSAVLTLLEEVQHFFERLNRLARMPLLRFLSRLGNGALDNYYRKHCDAVDRAISDWKAFKKDKLFFNAHSVILVGSKPGASTPTEDALLATQNILLAAHAMGLGTCLIGFAAAALKRDPKIRKRMGIPKEEFVHAVIALGYTDRTFFRMTRKRKATTRFLSLRPTTL